MSLPRDMNLTLWIPTLGVTWEQNHTHARLTTLEVSRDRYVTYLMLDSAIFEESIPEIPHARHKEFERQAFHIPGIHQWDQWETGTWYNSRQWEYPEISVYQTLDILLQRDVRLAAQILDVPRFPNSHVADFEVFCLTFRPLPLLWGRFVQTDYEKNLVVVLIS
jgi:hypothetical protein